MHNGWIKLHRKFLSWEWYQDANTARLFIHLLIKSNHKDKKWKGHLIRKGQVLTGRKMLAKELDISEQNVRTSIRRLISTNEITIKPTNQFSIITICNYENYQSGEIESNQQTNQPANQRLTSNQPATNQQLTTTKNVKNDKNEKNEKKKETPPPTPHASGGDTYRRFKHLVLTYEEYYKLLAQGMTKEKIDNYCDKIENLQNNDQYTSLFLTIKIWNAKDDEHSISAMQKSKIKDRDGINR